MLDFSICLDHEQYVAQFKGRDHFKRQQNCQIKTTYRQNSKHKIKSSFYDYNNRILQNKHCVFSLLGRTNTWYFDVNEGKFEAENDVSSLFKKQLVKIVQKRKHFHLKPATTLIFQCKILFFQYYS